MPEHISKEVPCINPEVSVRKNARTGSHCENFHLHTESGDHHYMKKSWSMVSGPDLERYKAEYDRLKQDLGDMIPAATFVRTRVGQAMGAIALVEPVDIVTDVLAVRNEEYIKKVLSSNPATREQLAKVLSFFDQWQEKGKVLDISDSGEENLVLDKDGNVKYVDSFDVFLNNRYESLVDSAKQNAERIRKLLKDTEN